MPEFIGIAVVDDQGRIHLDKPAEQKKFCAEYFNGHEVEVCIRKRRSKRSLKQNAAYHASIEPLAEHLGYTVEELKLAMLGGCFGWKNVNGCQLPERMHTSDLDTQQFSDLMAYTNQIAAEHDILILDPSQWKASKRKASRRGGLDHKAGPIGVVHDTRPAGIEPAAASEGNS